MTSRECKPGNIYGPDTEPNHSILLYTWGRYEMLKGPRLETRGIGWQVPWINETPFTVAG